MSTRTELVAYLKTATPDYRVLPYFKDLDGPSSLTVMVQTERVEKADTGVWTAFTSVLVVTGVKDPERAEDTLDVALDRVLRALADYPPSIDADAERVLYGDALQAYRINLQIPYFIGEETN